MSTKTKKQKIVEKVAKEIGYPEEMVEHMDLTEELKNIVKEDVKITPDLIQAGERIAKSTCVLEIHIRRPGYSKRLKSDNFLEVNGNAGEVSADILKVSQDIIERKEVKDLEVHRKKFLRYLEGLSLPGGMLTLGGGQYLIPLDRVEEVRNQIILFNTERSVLLEDFEKRYPEIIEGSKIKRGAFFDTNDYPAFSVIKGRYSEDHRFIGNSLPENFEALNKQIYQEEKQRLSLQCASAANDMRETLRQSYLELVTNLTEKLKPNEDGTIKTLNKTRVEKLIDFINSFEKLDYTNDSSLKNLISKTKQIMSGCTIDDLKDSSDIRKIVKDSFDIIISEATDMVQVQTRYMELDD